MSAHRFDSILVASDLSDGADAGLQAAAQLAYRAGADLHVFHCVPQPVFPYWEGLVDEKTRQRWLHRARLDLEWQVRRVLGDRVAPASCEATIGEPAREVNERANATSADLVVLGPHRPRRAFDDLLGTTADRVIRSSPVPCLLTNRPLRLPLRRVLLPTDFSEPADRAMKVGLDWLVSLARQGVGMAPTRVELLYVSAYASPSARPLAIEPRLSRRIEIARRRIPRGAAIKLLPRILSAPLPVDGILWAAEQIDCDLIILGTHGYGTLARALLGSVASAVARTVPFPILLVPPP